MEINKNLLTNKDLRAIVRVNKGKPVERQGRKAKGLRLF